MSSSLPRPTLNPFEKHRLGKQFGQEVPEFADYHKKKKDVFEASLKVGAVLGLVAGVPAYQKSYQPLTGIFVAAMGFLAGQSFVKHVAGRAYGLNPLNDAEYERAFNLWVYYEHNPYRKQQDLPVHTMDARYQQSLAEFREKHKNEYQKFLAQQ